MKPDKMHKIIEAIEETREGDKNRRIAYYYKKKINRRRFSFVKQVFVKFPKILHLSHV